MILDIRDHMGRFFTRVKITDHVYFGLEFIAKSRGITFEDAVREAIREYCERRLSEVSSK